MIGAMGRYRLEDRFRAECAGRLCMQINGGYVALLLPFVDLDA
jgi:hypothetical protein